MRIEQRKLLMAVDDVDRIVDVEGHGFGWHGIARTVKIDHHPHQADQLTQARRIFPARHRRLRTEIPAAVGKPIAGQLERRIGAPPIEIVGILKAAGDRQNARPQDVRQEVDNPVRSRRSAISAASFAQIPSRRSAAANSITPPSEVIRPPSKAAVTFLRATAGKVKGSSVSSVMADVAASIP